MHVTAVHRNSNIHVKSLIIIVFFDRVGATGSWVNGRGAHLRACYTAFVENARASCLLQVLAGHIQFEYPLIVEQG
jgi:hypothetical protein